MSEDLRNLEFPGGKEDLLCFLREVISDRVLSIEDVQVLCSKIPVRYMLCNLLIDYCSSFHWIMQNNGNIWIDASLSRYIASEKNLNTALIISAVRKMFDLNIFSADMFKYDVSVSKILFRNELLPLVYSSIRNVLVSQGFFEAAPNSCGNLLYINPNFEELVFEFCKEKIQAFTLASLKEKLEKNSIAGAKAEEFVLKFEQQRITNRDLSGMIRIISDVDVGAGYDVLSFETNQSVQYDRYIEVKAIDHMGGFFWSANEYEIAKLKGIHYYLYLVDLAKTKLDGYSPIVISNPAIEIMKSNEWFIEPKVYYINHV